MIYTLSTPEGRAEVRRLVEALPSPLDNTDGVVWTVDGRQIDDEGNYETWQVKVADTAPDYAPFFAAAPTLLLAALEEIERLRGITPERDNAEAEVARLTARWERLSTKLRDERLASLAQPVEGYTDGLDSALYMMATLERGCGSL